MSQNLSHAVMAQRHEPHDSLDFFPTPPWATRALCEYLLPLKGLRVWEPACGDCSMARPLIEYAGDVFASDIHDYGLGRLQHDFLMPFVPKFEAVDSIVTNPPFRLGEAFALRALEIARSSVALLVRSVFTEGAGRYERLFSIRPPSIVAQFVERVPMVKGRLDRTASSATAYAWLVWQRVDVTRAETTRFVWIPPCRARLERDSDYPT